MTRGQPVTPNGSMVPRLRASLSRRLSEVEAEATAIRSAIAALDDHDLTRAVGRESRPPAIQEMLARTLAHEPGSRASMLALTSGYSLEQITAALATLEAKRQVRRDGLGWSLIATHPTP